MKLPISLFITCLFVATAAQARYMAPQLKQVPVERLAENLQAAIDEHPESAEAYLNLARLHAMAYASKSETAPTNTRKNGEVWYGYEPVHAPFELAPSDDPEKLKAARGHLDKAVELYKKAAELDPKNLTVQLGYAWCLEQAGQKDEARAAYRQTIEAAWLVEKDKKRAGLGWHSVTAEAAGYLKPLLDPAADADEIATLDERAEKMSQVMRPVTPIAVPLTAVNSAAEIEDKAAAVAFDADGSGYANRWTWIKPTAGWLVYDAHGAGQIESGLQLFGNVSFWLFWQHGYQPLAALDNNADGQLTGAELTHLAIWQDANQNGLSEPGEVRPVSQWQIVSLACRSQTDARHADQIQYAPAGVTFANGETRPTFDLVLQPR